MATNIQICVVAHNEEKHILGCLQSIQKALSQTSDISCTVDIINNGSSDNTHAIAQSYCEDKDGWRAHNVEMGDKANAWNLGIYQYATNDDLTVYIDGDCRMTPDTISAFIQVHNEKPDAYIYAGVPATVGRTTEQTIANTLKGNALSGNLYALSTQFIKKVRSVNFTLPIGLIGDDSLLAWVSTQDFKLSNNRSEELMIGVSSAKFHYHRLTATSWSNIKLYYRRMQRYSLRHLQQCCIRQFLEKEDCFEQLPDRVDDLYVFLSKDFIRQNSPINKFFDRREYLKIPGDH